MSVELLPYLLPVTIGFRHAFETDHLVAVSNIVTKRNSVWLSVKDGIYWGLGHSSSILFIGILMLLLRWGIPEKYFQMMEGGVGVMIIILGLFRLFNFFKNPVIIHHHNGNTHKHNLIQTYGKQNHIHRVSYGVGIIHGLAGSGVLIAAAMATMKTVGSSLAFLIVFSLGCIGGMLVASGVLGMPFSKKLHAFANIQKGLVIFSCIICLVLGAQIVFENWIK